MRSGLRGQVFARSGLAASSPDEVRAKKDGKLLPQHVGARRAEYVNYDKTQRLREGIGQSSQTKNLNEKGKSYDGKNP